MWCVDLVQKWMTCLFIEKKNMFCVTVLAVTVHCWHHLERQQSAASLCSLVLTEHCFLIKTIRGGVLLCCKKILTCFFIEKSCFVCLFLQWKCDIGITLTKVSTKEMFVFTWSNLPSFWVQMKHLVWHVSLPSQTCNTQFHWKILFLCGGFDRDIAVLTSPWQKSVPSWCF